jgi:hypothetical protein
LDPSRSRLDISGWDKFFVDITDIRELGILVLLLFDDPKKIIGLQLLELDKTSKIHILETT